MASKKPPKTFEGFGVHVDQLLDPALVRGRVEVRGQLGKITSAPLWLAYGYRAVEPLERIARSPAQAWENALRAQDAEIAQKEAALEAARAKRAVIQRELDKVTRDEARKEQPDALAH